jgi:hemoglobin-like flavoprotein
MRWPWTKRPGVDEKIYCPHCSFEPPGVVALAAHLMAEHADQFIGTPEHDARLLAEIHAEVPAPKMWSWSDGASSSLRFNLTQTQLEKIMEATDTAPPVNEPDTGAGHRAEDDPTLTMGAPRAICHQCRGTGKVLTMRDYLDEVVGFLPTDPAQLDALIAEFYNRLVRTAPGLKPLFPPDLTTGDALNSRGHKQRDELLNALVLLLTRYDPTVPASNDMIALKTSLGVWGRNHRDFARPDGTRSGATPDEYLIVRDVLVGLLMDVVGPMWEPVHTSVLASAYHFAMIEMLHAAQEAGPVQHPVARQPRTAPTRPEAA